MTIIGALPVTLQNGTTAEATEVMADLNKIRNDVNSNAAANGANADITSLSGLTTPLSVAQGGTPVRIGGTSTGSANAQVVATTSPSGFTLTNGLEVTFTPGFTNTTATTLNVNSTGATNIFKPSIAGPVALTGGEIVVGNKTTVVFDGTQYQLVASGTAAGGVNYQAFTDTAGGTWTRPINYTASSRVLVQAWGAGGGGGTDAASGGAGGGAYVSAWFLASALTSTVAVAVGAGGATATVGGNSTFGAFLTAYGGGGGHNTANTGGGGGGGALAAGGQGAVSSGGDGGEPRPIVTTLATLLASASLGVGSDTGSSGEVGAGNVDGGGGGGGGGTAGFGAPGGISSNGGGGGGAGGSTTGGAGGRSIYGGGGGGGKAAAGGASLFGGTGGTGGGTAPTAPGGGGGRNVAGARGEVRVTTFI